MNIYKISQSEFDGFDYYTDHIIAANNQKEAIELAQNISDSEGKNVWCSADIQKVGTYTGDVLTPFILLSNYTNA